MLEALDRFFKIEERGSRPATELVAGLTTFATMAYIIFVQPSIMSGAFFGMDTGMDFGALTSGVCIAAAFGSILMGALANYPVALAPGMGENIFFVLTAIPACAVALGCKAGDAAAWRLALGIVFISGTVFAILSFCRLRKLLLGAISPSMKSAIAGGIGIFIAFLGLKNCGLIAIGNGALSLKSHLGATPQTVFLIGMVITGGMLLLRVKGAILAGMLAAAVAAWALGLLKLSGGIVSAPPSIAPIFGKMDIAGAFTHFIKLLPLLVIFLYMDIFDTLGTLVGVATEAKLMKDGELVDATKAFAADSCGTVAGAVFGHSTVTSYIESAAGVAHGGRTGLVAVVSGLCFLGAMFFVPLVKAVSGCPAITAPALVVVGAMMSRSVARIDWDDISEAIPSFLVLVGIPFSFSIGDGMMLGFILYPFIKLIGGRAKDAGWLSYSLAIVLLLYMIFIKT